MLANPQKKNCKICGNLHEPHYQNGIASRVCHECQRNIEMGKKIARVNKMKTAKKKERTKKLMMCLRCKERPREDKKKTTSCRTCRLAHDPMHWGEKVWGVFSLYIRTKMKKEKGVIECYTCDKPLELKEAQAGHCFHKGRGRYKALDYDPRHIRPQCGDCNVDTDGMVNVFQSRLTRELGIEAVDNMILRRHTEAPLEIEELKTLYEHFSEQVKSYG